MSADPQNHPSPPHPHQVYVSTYLDRLLEVHQDDYYFKAKFYFYLTWTDERAYDQMLDATADATANNGTCDKLCNGQRPFGPTQNCCAGVWLPSLLSRNVMMYPQDRVQPYNIDVKPDGTVNWRVEVTGMWYTFLQLRAFPFDRQRLTVSLAYTNFNPRKSVVDLIPSASGTDIFTLGEGDTLSGWDVVDVWVEANANKTFQSQFKSFARDASNPDDPAPINPPPGDDAQPYGTNVTVSSITVVIGIKRLSLNYVFTVILPILFVTCVAMLALFIDPCSLSLRMTTVLTCMLTLLALVYLIDPSMPASSYMLPTKALAVLSYASLAVIAVESLAAYEVARRPALKAAAAERAAALRAVAAARGARRRTWHELFCLAPPPLTAVGGRSSSIKSQASFGGRGNERTPSDEGGEAGSARGASGDGGRARKLANAYYQALARRMDTGTLVTLAAFYVLMVLTIFLAGQAQNTKLRPGPAVRLAPTPAGA